MILSMKFQIQLMTMGFMVGIIGAFAYDVLRIQRKYIRHSDFAKGFEDLMFWIVYGFGVFLFCLRVNYGEIRPFFLCCLFIAMIVYYFFVSNIVWNITIPVLDTIIGFLKKILQVLSLPFVFILRQTMFFLKFIFKICENSLQIKMKYEKIKGRFVRPYFRGGLNGKKEENRKSKKVLSKTAKEKNKRS